MADMRRWMRREYLTVVAIIAVILIVLVGWTVNSRAEAAAEAALRTQECHTRLMDEMHARFYAYIGEAPGQPMIWGPKWVEAFDEWEKALPSCTVHDI